MTPSSQESNFWSRNSIARGSFHNNYNILTRGHFIIGVEIFNYTGSDEIMNNNTSPLQKALRCTKDSNLDSILHNTLRDSAGNGKSPGDNHLGVSTIPRQDGHTHLSHITAS